MPFGEPNIVRMTLAQFAELGLSRIATLYIPPRDRAALDLEMVDRLRIPRSQLQALDVGTANTEDLSCKPITSQQLAPR
jgi:hypothetical protein